MAERLGEYRLLDEVGRSTTAVVRLAVDASGREVAVKELLPAAAADTEARRRLAREIAAQVRVRSPYVARLIGGDVAADRPYAVTQYVPGPTLRDMIRSYGPLRGTALLEYARLTALGLADVHDAGVVHRDLTPGNIMVLGGAPVIIDFGIAHEAGAVQVTRPGMIMGTPAYLAPELIEGEHATAASDVFAWAVTLAYAGTGRPPYGTGSLHRVCYRILSGAADLAGLPDLLASLVRPALARDPRHRPPARRLAGLLAPFCLSGPPGVPGTTGPAPGSIAAGCHVT